MRFSDLFISYKIGLKSIKSTIPFTKLPTYRKVFMIFFIASMILSGIIWLLTQKNYFSAIPIGIGVFCIFIFEIIDSRKNNLQIMLNDYYAPYSRKRMQMVVNVLNEYNIDIKDIKSIDGLIEEARLAQKDCDYIKDVKKSFKTLGAMIIPIIVFVAKKIGDNVKPNEMIEIAIQAMGIIILIFALIFLLEPIIKELFYIDYNKYQNLIDDLRQIKLFYATEHSIDLRISGN